MSRGGNMFAAGFKGWIWTSTERDMSIVEIFANLMDESSMSSLWFSLCEVVSLVVCLYHLYFPPRTTLLGQLGILFGIVHVFVHRFVTTLHILRSPRQQYVQILCWNCTVCSKGIKYSLTLEEAAVNVAGQEADASSECQPEDLRLYPQVSGGRRGLWAKKSGDWICILKNCFK